MEQGPADFRMDMSVDAAAVRVTVFGEIDVTTAPMLDEGLGEAAAGLAHGPAGEAAGGSMNGVPEVILDLRHLEFIDSSGLGVLIAHHKSLLEAGRRLVLESPSEPARRVLVISGLDKVLTIRTEPAS